ncbi:hypothetical protein MYCTH_2299469 [Thermothelomyces thermophilus ATCC 42464]|uniref:Uncharacterized protein n=1 Tax=Thermothelomyces thermophilus (strain ATCC 42464 / BCRC 31852 / DSM 1799) TaxID=573729 RepID=G2Q648_THET4|nr:uncharacterized protein MYCTH_2299469 [Thermothelomyces thermophilus ATCC 42464]AEO55527.1 hypothetical protein MYCTH_2299469 [Thermothelomyces thermophilus ATCC 42464]
MNSCGLMAVQHFVSTLSGLRLCPHQRGTGTLNAAQAADKAIRSSLPLRCSEHPAAAGLPVSWPMHANIHLVGGCSDLQKQTTQEKRLNHLSDPRCGTQSMPSPDKLGGKLALKQQNTGDDRFGLRALVVYEVRIERLTGRSGDLLLFTPRKSGSFRVKRSKVWGTKQHHTGVRISGVLLGVPSAP